MKRLLRSQHDYRTTLLRNQLTSLVLFESITTTLSKAKELVAFTNHFFNSVKANQLNQTRLAHQTLLDKNAVRKVFEELLPRYGQTETTFVRLLRTKSRHGDNAAMAIITFIRPLSVVTKKNKEETAVTPVESKPLEKTTAKKSQTKTITKKS